MTACGQSPLFNHKLEKSISDSKIEWATGQELKFASVEMSFGLDWVEGPGLGQSKFILHSWDSKNSTAAGPYKDIPGNLHVFLWMPSMGHGSSPVKISKNAIGEYMVSNVYFIMGGDWDVKIQRKVDNKVVDEVVISLNL